jgi:hypothetical protein
MQFDASGGTPPYEWVAGALPSGLTLDSAGLIAGSATSAGDQSVEVSVEDAENERADATLTLSVAPGPSITTSSLPEATVGSAYSIQLSATSGDPPYSWTIAGGGLPGGFVLSSSGLLSGRPGTAGDVNVDLEVIDSLGATTDALLGFTVLPLPLPSEGYATVDASGRTEAVDLGAPSAAEHVPGKTVGLAVEPSGAGYWSVTATGRVHNYGAARYFGSVARRDLRGVAVGIAAPLGSTGYWVATSTGHVYGFGAVRSLGSLATCPRPGFVYDFGASRSLGAPPDCSPGASVVGIAATPTGRGYWLVTATGHVYGFGSARELGSVPPRALVGKIVAIAATTAVPGYLLVSSTGRVYGFGAARPLPPSAGPVRGTVVGIAVPQSPAGAGYWLLTRTGAVFAFGGAREVATSPPQPLSDLHVVAPFVGIEAGR